MPNFIHRMANVLLTNFCNRKCPYCFATEKVRTDDSGNGSAEGGVLVKTPGCMHMPMENVREVVAFFKRSGLRLISLLGGEPTLHPQFEEVVRLISDDGFSIKLFTNGLMPARTARFLTSLSTHIGVMVNINHPSIMPPDQWSHVNETLGILGDKGSLSYNIYQSDCDLEFLPQVILTHGLTRAIRLGLAMPIYGHHNSALPMDEYARVGEKLADFSDVCSHHDISLRLDCGFPVCMFTSEQMGRIMYNNGDVNFVCRPIIDIGPDLKVWSCFPLSGLNNVSLRDFDNRDQLVDYYEKIFSPYRRVGALSKCIDCAHLRRQQCFGGCVAHTLMSFHNGAMPPARAEIVHN